jgi:hypothetical protein
MACEKGFRNFDFMVNSEIKNFGNVVVFRKRCSVLINLNQEDFNEANSSNFYLEKLLSKRRKVKRKTFCIFLLTGHSRMHADFQPAVQQTNANRPTNLPQKRVPYCTDNV